MGFVSLLYGSAKFGEEVGVLSAHSVCLLSGVKPAVEEVAVTVRPDPGGLVGHGGVGLDLEEVGGPDVRVALLVAGVDRGQVDLGGDRGVERVLAGHELAGEGAELAPYLAYHHVPGGEADLAVDRVDRPGARDVAGDAGQGAGVSSGHGVFLLSIG